MIKFSYWGINKYGDWYDAYFSADIYSESLTAIKSHSKGKNILFAEYFSYLDFVDEFKKLNVKHDLFTDVKTKRIIATISSNDIDFLIKNDNYEYRFIEVPNSIPEKVISNIPNNDLIEELHRGKHNEVASLLDSLGSSLLYVLNDGIEVCLFCKSRELIDRHLIELFKYRIKNLDTEYKDKFTDKKILQIMNYSSGSNEISDKFEIDTSGSIKFKLSNRINKKRIRTCIIIVDDEKVVFSEWDEKSHRDLASFKENRKGQMACLLFVSIIFAGLYYLIKFLIGLF